mmetsp:Transcript_6613/g.15107  ORF Transcript_6613/g.15107 Transcript_6613/m.15107 type:complete len:733 (+) Transcript_6613:286-2484(+)
MHRAGLETFCYTSIQDDELLVLLRCPMPKMKSFADAIDFKLELCPDELEKLLLRGGPNIGPISINADPQYSAIPPHNYIYAKFETSLDGPLYRTPPGSASPFSTLLRLKLTYYLLRAPISQGGCGLGVSRMLYSRQMLSMFPLHDRGVTGGLLASLRRPDCFPWSVPFEELRQYVGEKLALHSVFLGHYSRWLLLPAVVGLPFQVVVLATDNYSSPALPCYSAIICMWGILMLEYWKRQEAYTAMQWGMTDFEVDEPERPEFQGQCIKSFVHGREMLYYPPRERGDRLMGSASVVGAYILLVVGVVVSIYLLRYSLQTHLDATYASVIASVLNTLQILVFNFVYARVVKQLTDNENHRTDTLYEDSMIVKLFAFQFVNSYTSFFFLGFIATYLTKPDGAPEDSVGQCGASNCMQPMAVNLAIIFGTRLLLNNFLDIFLPYLSWTSKYKKETDGVAEDVVLTPAERDYLLVEYKNMLENISAYADTAIQFGYCMLFISALPLAATLSLFNNMVRMKFYTYKLFRFYQRPTPNGAQDIGTWMAIFQFLGSAAVVTNGALICFTMDLLWDKYTLSGRMWVFIGFQWTLLGLQFLSAEIIEDVPTEVTIQTERNEFMNLKVVEKVADEDYGAEAEVQEEEEVRGVGKMGCKSVICCKRPANQRRGRKVEDREAYPQMHYPFQQAPTGWPRTLDGKDKMGKGAKEAKGAKDVTAVAVPVPLSAVAMPPPPPTAPGYV